MLVYLFNTPRNENDWNVWSLAHHLHHLEIRQAIQRKNNSNLIDYQLDPIVLENEWLKRNAQTHEDMNAQLNLQGSNLEDVDFDDEKQLQAWIYSHYKEHQDAAAALQI